MVDVAGTEDLLDTVTQLKRLRGADGGAASAETEESSMAAAVAAAASSNDVETVLDIEASAPDTPPTSPISGRDHEVQEDSISGGHLANPPFLLPDSGFASPASEDVVSAAEDVGAATDGFTMRRRSTRMRAAGANKDEQFRQRLTKQRHRDRLFELREDGSYEMKEMTIREVFAYVQEIVAPYALCLGMSPKGAADAAGAPSFSQQQQQQQQVLRRSSAPASASSTPPKNGRDSSEGRSNSVPGGDGMHGASRHGYTRTRRSASIAGGMTMSSLNLHLRDMRQLFSSQSKSEPAISVRRNCILVNFETLRGIVLVDRILLVVDPGADSILMEVKKAVSESHDDVYEFELKAVEALLSVSSKRLEKEVREVEQPIAKIVNLLEGPGKGATSAKNNDRFRVLLNSINVLENRAKARKRALLMALDDDTDLAMMNLTRMFQNPEDYVPPLSTEVLEDHEEMELLLEAFLQDINSIYNVLELLQGRARSTEALVMVKLDIARNRILTAGLVFSMASTCLTLGALVSGIFGMNLNSGMETQGAWLFRLVAIGTACACAFGFLGTFTFFYRHGLLVS